MSLAIKRRIGIIRDYKRTDWRMYGSEEERKRKLAKLATPSHRTGYPRGLTRGWGTIARSSVYGRRVAICGPYFPNSYRAMTHEFFEPPATLQRATRCEGRSSVLLPNRTNNALSILIRSFPLVSIQVLCSTHSTQRGGKTLYSVLYQVPVRIAR